MEKYITAIIFVTFVLTIWDFLADRLSFEGVLTNIVGAIVATVCIPNMVLRETWPKLLEPLMLTSKVLIVLCFFVRMTIIKEWQNTRAWNKEINPIRIISLHAVEPVLTLMAVVTTCAVVIGLIFAKI